MDIAVFDVFKSLPIWLCALCVPWNCKPPMPYACVVASVGQANVIKENI